MRTREEIDAEMAHRRVLLREVEQRLGPMTLRALAGRLGARVATVGRLIEAGPDPVNHDRGSPRRGMSRAEAVATVTELMAELSREEAADRLRDLADEELLYQVLASWGPIWYKFSSPFRFAKRMFSRIRLDNT